MTATGLLSALHISNIATLFLSFTPSMNTWVGQYNANFNRVLLTATCALLIALHDLPPSAVQLLRLCMFWTLLRADILFTACMQVGFWVHGRHPAVDIHHHAAQVRPCFSLAAVLLLTSMHQRQQCLM